MGGQKPGCVPLAPGAEQKLATKGIMRITHWGVSRLA